MNKKKLSQADMVSAILKNQNPDEYLKQLDGLSWCELLRKRPDLQNQFGKKAGKMDGCDWSLLLSKKPDDFESFCDTKNGWKEMEGPDWALLLLKDPDKFERVCDAKKGWGIMEGLDWALLLSNNPSYFERVCDDKKGWEKMKGPDWALLLARCPEFEDKYKEKCGEKMEDLPWRIAKSGEEQGERGMDEKVKSSVFDFSFGGALRDAILRKAFDGHKQKLIESGQMLAVQLLVRGYIDNLLAGHYKEEESHTNAYRELTKTIRKILTPVFNTSFVFGNIQKLVNMTAKYIYVACYANENIRDCFKYCHCPMDSVMIQTVKTDYEKDLGRKKNVKWNDVRWSKIDGDLASATSSTTGTNKLEESIDVYIQFQEMVKELSDSHKIYPIEYDFLNWKRDE